MHVGTKRKTPLPPPTCFNVPDTLDFSGTACRFHKYLMLLRIFFITSPPFLCLDEDNDEMESNLDTQEVITQEYDSTILLKSRCMNKFR